jgi:2-polyprenyl-6-methoxyphenol hydroxylase-like FAD-dependent oxidoreductase
MMDTKTDVLVVGAGPVGLTRASEMARYGLSVPIIDKNTERTDKSKALVLWPRTLELMDRMGAGCTKRFIDAGFNVSGANIVSGRDEIASIEMISVASKTRGQRPQTNQLQLAEQTRRNSGTISFRSCN